VLRIRFIKRAQELGFSLRDIKELLSLRVDPGTTQVDIRERAQEKLADVERKMKHLEAIRMSLIRLTNNCSGCGPLGECPILEKLEGKEF
jgi:MerR family copper efflux transcriptional regulator